MTDLIFTRLVDTTEIKGFTCGVADIDNLIREYLPDMVSSGCVDVYAVRTKTDQQLVAIFSLSHGIVTLDTIDLNEMHGDYSDIAPEDIRYTNFKCLEIDLLAVEKSAQHKHFGRTIISKIMRNRIKFGFENAVYILVDAFYTKGYTTIPFYENCGFYYTGQDSAGDTVRMVKEIE